MAKEAVCQVRMDVEMKEQVEALYRRMGSSFAEAVRMFAAQSLREQGLPFRPTVLAGAVNAGSARGIAAKYADPALIGREEGAFAQAMEKKHDAD